VNSPRVVKKLLGEVETFLQRTRLPDTFDFAILNLHGTVISRASIREKRRRRIIFWGRLAQTLA
jgi:hypothetical protein